MSYKSLTIIGLTGNIACGKSTVLAMLHALGAYTIDADAVTHGLQQPGQAVYQQIVAAFGSEILLEPGGAINRKALGAIVFSDPEQLRRLEQIVHPAVREHIWAWLNSLVEGFPHPTTPLLPLWERGWGEGLRVGGEGKPVAVIDAIKLIESGWLQICDSLWVVSCPPEQQLQRLMATRGMDEAEARRRIVAQSPQAEKISRANVVISNAGSLAETQHQVEAAWRMLIG